MLAGRRSLNLATAVGIGVYLALASCAPDRAHPGADTAR
jgi:hypothetical protein